MSKVIDFNKYWKKKFNEGNYELIEEVSKELDKYGEIFTQSFLEKMKQDLADELLGPYSKKSLLRDPSNQEIPHQTKTNPRPKKTKNIIEEIASDLPEFKKYSLPFEEAIELISIMHLSHNLSLIQLFLKKKKQEILPSQKEKDVPKNPLEDS